MIHDRGWAIFSNFSLKLAHSHLFTIRLVQHCAATSATAELSLRRFYSLTLVSFFVLEKTSLQSKSEEIYAYARLAMT